MKRKILLGLILPLLIGACSSSNSSTNSTSKIVESSSFSTSEESTFVTSSDAISSSEVISSSSSSERKEEKDEIIGDTYRLKFDSILLRDENNNPINISVDVNKSDLSFDHDSTVFNKRLAVASLPFVVNAPYLDKINNVFNFFEFDNLSISNEYETEETKETLLYVFAHKKINDYDLINITVSGYNYKKPWQENLTIGTSDNHQGFNKMAMKLFPLVNDYLNNYKSASKVKVYINGYSRSAAICNILSTLLVDSGLVKEENLYAYLFETPKGLSSNNQKEYKSIFNIINSADFITYVAPSEYDLKRAGIDIEIYSETADEIIAKYNDKLNIGVFTPNESEDNGYSNDIEFVKYLVNYLLQPIDDENLEKPCKDISSRTNYCNNLQDDIAYLIAFIFDLPEEATNKIMETFNNKELYELLPLLEEDGIYNFLKPILDEFKIVYEEEELKNRLNNFLYFVQQKSNILFMAMSKETRDNLLRTIYFHTLETVVPLLINL